MAIKTVQGRKFILVARPGISSNTSMFPQKVVQLSGHGINSGKEFSVNVKVNAGLQKANINKYRCIVLLLIGILALSLWVSELSKSSNNINSNVESRLSILEEQLKLADSTSTEFLSDINS